MARNKTRHLEPRQKNLAKLFEVACYRNNRGMVWSDFMSMAAISISNTVDKAQAEEREKLYLRLVAKYNDKELEAMTRMFAEIVEGMEEDPDRDFLGELSLLGCAGYVVVADTLRHPAVCLDDRGLIPAPGQTVWYTPMYFREMWHWRRVAALMDLSVRRNGKC